MRIRETKSFKISKQTEV